MRWEWGDEEKRACSLGRQSSCCPLGRHAQAGLGGMVSGGGNTPTGPSAGFAGLGLRAELGFGQMTVTRRRRVARPAFRADAQASGAQERLEAIIGLSQACSRPPEHHEGGGARRRCGCGSHKSQQKKNEMPAARNGLPAGLDRRAAAPAVGGGLQRAARGPLTSRGRQRRRAGRAASSRRVRAAIPATEKQCGGARAARGAGHRGTWRRRRPANGRVQPDWCLAQRPRAAVRCGTAAHVPGREQCLGLAGGGGGGGGCCNIPRNAAQPGRCGVWPLPSEEA